MPRRRSAGSANFPRVFFDMEPDAEELRHDLLLLERQISDYDAPLQYSKRLIIEDVKETFRIERDPVTGRNWPALSERAEREPHIGILRRRRTNAKMYRAAVAKNNYGVTKQGVFFNQSRLPNYAAVHQQDDTSGTPKINMNVSKAELINEISRRRKAGYKERGPSEIKAAAKHILDNRRIDAEGGGVPQRRFMGVSPYTQNLIIGTMNQWAEDAIIIYRRQGLTVKRRRRIEP